MSSSGSPWVTVLMGMLVGVLIGIVGAIAWADAGLETESADAAVVMAPVGGLICGLLGAATGYVIWALRSSKPGG
ncbi:hypothetical protein E0H73_16875 [Kribbella pittospori]|uniref:Uncharacterized protein n=1 Tax=Kribbella pittospori TaxID=722689 RepID=A0A4R0KRV6_9ACTN|nr:hypothetical protein [Kribbella pittospori]TCC60938.1 hypothetical protein E0H73_16875 [Kribbella pittospori]